MNLIDVLIVLFFISALVRGVELGLVRQFFSTAGLLGGLFLGVFIQGKVIHHVSTPNAKAMLTLGIIVASIGLVGALSEFIGARLKDHIRRSKIKAITGTDKTLGSVMAGATLLLAIWLGAAIFSNVPFSGLQKQLKNSVVIATLNKNLPSAPDIVTGLGHLIDPNTFPNVFTGLEPEIDTDRPLPSIGDLDTAVQKARASTVKVEGEGCGGVSQGSGFVAAANLIITNAHVVAGVTQPVIVDANGRHRAQVVLFNPELDMAVLRAGNLAGQPLLLKNGIADAGTPAAILGYPGGGDFTAGPATIVGSFKAVGRDIYNQNETTRDVYSVKGTVQPGNSGGPLVNKDGDVIGLIFAESTVYNNVGYSLVMDSVINNFNQAKNAASAVATGGCRQ